MWHVTRTEDKGNTSIDHLEKLGIDGRIILK